MSLMDASADKPHILVVDDDTRLRELLRTFLSKNGFRVTVASHAAEAPSSGSRPRALLYIVLMNVASSNVASKPIHSAFKSNKGFRVSWPMPGAGTRTSKRTSNSAGPACSAAPPSRHAHA